jgi:hypothetical protein
METKRLILGIYLEPSVWVCNNGEHVDPKSISPEECVKVVFSKTLPHGIEVCVQRQGFIVVAFPESILNMKISEIKSANLLPIRVAQIVLSFFNAFLFLVYNQTYKYYNGSFGCVKQAIDISGIWRWINNSETDLSAIAVEQPIPILKQDEFTNIEITLYLHSKTVGKLVETDKLFRSEMPSEILDQTFNLLLKDSDIQNNWQLLALLNKAVCSIQRAEFAESHVLSWSVAEKLIETEWKNYVESTNAIIGSSGEKTVNSRRLTKLVSPDYDASHRMEILELAKIIPYELYKKSISARKTRNDWLHYLKSVTQEECINSYLVARDLLSRKIGFNIEHPGAFYFQDEHISEIPDSSKN